MDAFEEGLVALLPRLRRFAHGLSGNRAEADDLAQIAVERALKARSQWQPGTRLDSWLYRIARKHGGRQTGGWSFDVPHLHLKSGALSPLRRFAFELRAIVARQSLPGYVLTLEQAFGRDRLNFTPIPPDPLAAAMRRVRLKPVENWP